MNESINKTTAYNIISSFLVQGITFLTIPVFTRILGTEQYGIYAVISSWVIMFSGVLDLGVGATTGIGRYHFPNEYCQYRTNVLKLILLLGISVASILFLISRLLTFVFDFSPTIMILILVMSLGRSLVVFMQLCLIYEKRPKENLILSLAVAVASTGLALLGVFLSKTEDRYIWKIGGETIGYLLAALVVVSIILVKHNAKLDKKYVKFAISIGFPFVFHEIARNVLNQSDRVMLRILGRTDAEIGIYSLYFSLAAILNVVLLALNSSWCPFFYDDLSEKRKNELLNKTKNYMELFSILTIGFLLVAREVRYVMADNRFSSGSELIPVFVVAIHFTFVYMFYVNMASFYKKTKAIAIGTMMAAIVNIILNYFLIPPYGIYGAAIATSISYGTLALFHYLNARFVLRIEMYFKLSMFIPGFLFLGAGVSMFFLLADYPVVRWILSGLLGVFELIRCIKRKTIF